MRMLRSLERGGERRRGRRVNSISIKSIIRVEDCGLVCRLVKKEGRKSRKKESSILQFLLHF